MSQRLFIRIDLTVPGAGTVIHIAELEEIDTRSCTMLRIIELDSAGTIQGAARPGTGESVGMANVPQQVVPHPDTYDDFPDVDHRALSEDEFEGLWTEATAKFPRL